jgi:hypothetical protein
MEDKKHSRKNKVNPDSSPDAQADPNTAKKESTKRETVPGHVQQPPGEKRIYRKDESDEQDSDGSASAFEDK